MEPIKKAQNDVMKVTMTCTINKYTINKVNKKKDNTEMRICNAGGYVVTSNGFKNVRLVIYNERYINLFEKYSQEGTKFLVFGRLSFRTYEKDGIKHEITEIVIGDQEEMVTMRTKRKFEEGADNTNKSQNQYQQPSVKIEDDSDSEEFDFSAFLDDKE